MHNKQYLFFVSFILVMQEWSVTTADWKLVRTRHVEMTFLHRNGSDDDSNVFHFLTEFAHG